MSYYVPTIIPIALLLLLLLIIIIMKTLARLLEGTPLCDTWLIIDSCLTNISVFNLVNIAVDRLVGLVMMEK